VGTQIRADAATVRGEAVFSPDGRNHFVADWRESEQRTAAHLLLPGDKHLGVFGAESVISAEFGDGGLGEQPGSRSGFGGCITAAPQPAQIGHFNRRGVYAELPEALALVLAPGVSPGAESGRVEDLGNSVGRSDITERAAFKLHNDVGHIVEVSHGGYF
jgi:hypothetical protein